MKKRLDLIDRGALGIGKANPLVFEKAEYAHGWNSAIAIIENAPTVDAVEVPCHCCDCYYLLNGKNSFGLYFFCGHQNGLKNLRNTEKDFCLYAERRYGDGNA